MQCRTWPRARCHWQWQWILSEDNIGGCYRRILLISKNVHNFDETQNRSGQNPDAPPIPGASSPPRARPEVLRTFGRVQLSGGTLESIEAALKAGQTRDRKGWQKVPQNVAKERMAKERMAKERVAKTTPGRKIQNFFKNPKLLKSKTFKNTNFKKQKAKSAPGGKGWQKKGWKKVPSELPAAPRLACAPAHRW